MKNMFLAVVCLLSLSTFAKDNSVNEVLKVGNFVTKLKKLDGKQGVATNNTGENGTGVCEVEVVDSEDTVSLYLNGTGQYFTPVAHIFYDTAKVKSDSKILVDTDSNRPGGDACGDFGGAVGYKKYITIENNKVTISESFRCTFELFKKYDLKTSCQL